MNIPSEQIHHWNEISLIIQEESAQETGERIQAMPKTLEIIEEDEIVEVEEYNPNLASSPAPEATTVNEDLFDGIFD